MPVQTPEGSELPAGPEHKAQSVTAIVPARNEEQTIGACVASLARQPQVTEIRVVDDMSSDGTAATVRRMTDDIPSLRVIETRTLPSGWVGKSHAAWVGAEGAQTGWLLFVDADAVLEPGAVERALGIASRERASLVSFSPEQITGTWYEKTMIPFVFTRLSRHFSFDEVNDPASPAAAANGQFLMVDREAYLAVGGHASVAGEVLEDVALAARFKSAGYRLHFADGRGVVRVRMYHSFRGMLEGWEKNLYLLVGGSRRQVARELLSVALFPILALLLLCMVKLPVLFGLGIALLNVLHSVYAYRLSRNGYPRSLILYYVPAVALYCGTLWASYRAHRRGKVDWKGRQIRVGTTGRIR